MPRPNCIVDGCPERQSTTNKYYMCYRHGEMAQFLLWSLPRIIPQMLEQLSASKEVEKTADKQENKLWSPDQGPSGLITVEEHRS